MSDHQARGRRVARWSIIVVLMAACVGYGTWKYFFQYQVREITGTLTQLDPATKRAEIEFPHPKSGDLIRLVGYAPHGCDIRVNDRQARLDELRIGDEVHVKGRLYTRSGRVVADSVRARHRELRTSYVGS